MTTMAFPLSAVRMILDWSVLSSLMVLAPWRVMLGLEVCLFKSLMVSALNSCHLRGGDVCTLPQVLLCILSLGVSRDKIW